MKSPATVPISIVRSNDLPSRVSKSDVPVPVSDKGRCIEGEGKSDDRKRCATLEALHELHFRNNEE